jgi:hypothetical protein
VTSRQHIPHPTISYGTSPEDCGGVREYVRRKVGPIFEKAARVPSETFSDSMAIVYRPNNLRRQTVFSLNTNSTSSVVVSAIRVRYGSSVKGLVFVHHGRVLLQFGKSKLTAIWGQRVGGRKEAFRFSGTCAQVEDGIVAKKEEIRAALDEALAWFCQEHNLSVGKIIWERAEESISGDSFLDGLPRDLILRDEVFQKVYADEGEFLTQKGGEPAVRVRRYIRNRALEEFAPAIAQELAELHDLVEVRVDPVEAIIGTLRRKEGVWYRLLCDDGPLHEVALRLSSLDMARLSVRLFEENAAGHLRNV